MLKARLHLRGVYDANARGDEEWHAMITNLKYLDRS
jgi:hypothetical protein